MDRVDEALTLGAPMIVQRVQRIVDHMAQQSTDDATQLKESDLLKMVVEDAAIMGRMVSAWRLQFAVEVVKGLKAAGNAAEKLEQDMAREEAEMEAQFAEDSLS